VEVGREKCPVGRLSELPELKGIGHMKDKTIAASIVLLSGCVIFGAGLISNTPLGFFLGLAIMLLGAGLTHRAWTGQTMSERFAEEVRDAVSPGEEGDSSEDDQGPQP